MSENFVRGVCKYFETATSGNEIIMKTRKIKFRKKRQNIFHSECKLWSIVWLPSHTSPV